VDRRSDPLQPLRIAPADEITARNSVSLNNITIYNRPAFSLASYFLLKIPLSALCASLSLSYSAHHSPKTTAHSDAETAKLRILPPSLPPPFAGLAPVTCAQQSFHFRAYKTGLRPRPHGLKGDKVHQKNCANLCIFLQHPTAVLTVTIRLLRIMSDLFKSLTHNIDDNLVKESQLIPL
jgi:hypothetical protein